MWATSVKEADSQRLNREVALPDPAYPYDLETRVPPSTQPPSGSQTVYLYNAADSAMASRIPVVGTDDEISERQQVFLPVLLAVLVGALLKWMTSFSFYQLVSDACLMLALIERDGRRSRP